MFDTLVPEGLRFGVLYDRLETVHRIYTRAEEAMASFRARNGLSCPPGCGVCCENFTPDILPVEASYLAAWLARNRPDKARELACNGFPDSEHRSARSCPLYNPDRSEAHCTVYPGRPLICRLFAFSGTRTRTGKASFSLCRLMPDLPTPLAGRRRWEGGELESALGVPPLMSDLAAEMDAVVPGEGCRRSLLTEALPHALRQMLFLAGFGSRGDPEDGGNGPVIPPLPNAS